MVNLRSATVFALMTLVLNSGVYAQPLRFSVANQNKVGSIVHGRSQNAGVCYFVDDRGYVATCFSNIRNCKEATVVFNDGQKFDVVGIVAASLGKDIAILEIAASGRTTTREDGALKLDPVAIPSIDEELVPWGGPMAIAAQASPELPKVKRRLIGEEFIGGQFAAPSTTIGSDPDTMWIWFNHARHRSCNGAPVFNRDGDVVAMLSGCLYSDSTIFSAIHIRHVHDLLPREGSRPKAKPLRANHSWVVPVPPMDSDGSAAQTTESEWSANGGRLQRERPLANRLQDLQDRIVKIEQEKAEIEIFRARYQSASLELLAESDKLKIQKAEVRPEEPYKVTETEIRIVRGGKDSKDGKEKTERVQVERTEYRFSARQLAFLKPIDEQLALNERKYAANNVEFTFTTKILQPFIATTRAKLDAEYFFIADPLGLRPLEEHRDLQGELSNIIDDGGAIGEVYVARAITRCNLKDYAGAAADLEEAREVNTRYQSLCTVVEAYIEALQASSKGTAELRAALKDSASDPGVLIMAARVDLANGSESLAAKKLQNASKILPNNYEIKLGLAWIYATTSAANEKLAVSYATEAVIQSAGRDWNARAALAASYATSGKFDLACEQISIALEQASGSALESCKQWSQQLIAEKPISRKFR